jgi:hypothetical protein
MKAVAAAELLTGAAVAPVAALFISAIGSRTMLVAGACAFVSK